MAKSPRSTAASNISRRRKNARSDGSEDYALKRRELTAIAAALFKAKGYEATTLADIAERAGLDRATVYYYVGSKQELFQTSVEGVLDENLTLAEHLLADSSTPARERLRSLMTALMMSYDANYPQMYVYIQEQMSQVARDDSKWSKEIQRKTRRLEAVVRELLEQGAKSGDFRTDIDAGLAAKAMFGMLNWTHRWYKPGSAVSAASVAEMFGKIYFEGIARSS